MYRSYEDPYKLTKMLEEARREYSDAVARGTSPEDLIDEVIWIEELEERLNHAWQDDEAEQFGYDY